MQYQETSRPGAKKRPTRPLPGNCRGIHLRNHIIGKQTRLGRIVKIAKKRVNGKNMKDVGISQRGSICTGYATWIDYIYQACNDLIRLCLAERTVFSIRQPICFLFAGEGMARDAVNFYDWVKYRGREAWAPFLVSAFGHRLSASATGRRWPIHPIATDSRWPIAAFSSASLCQIRVLSRLIKFRSQQISEDSPNESGILKGGGNGTVGESYGER
jgi:hypothetical protein